MVFELLELQEGAEVGVGIVQANNEAQCNQWCFFIKVVQEGASICMSVNSYLKKNTINKEYCNQQVLLTIIILTKTRDN